MDIYEKLRPGQSPRHLLMVGRIATAAVVLLGIVWIPVIVAGQTLLSARPAPLTFA